MHPLVAVALSYVSGSIPSAWIAGRVNKVNLRTQGSGNLGATNVMRVLGPRVAAIVFAVDIAKGALPVRFLPPLSTLAGDGQIWLAMACGFAAIGGHIRPVFLRFGKGGKGVATACGVFLALAPIQTLFALLIFVAVVLASGYVSLASLTAAASVPILLVVSAGVRSPLALVAIVSAGFVYWTHRANIQRLRNGSEFRFARAANFGRLPSLMLGVALLALAAAWLAARVG